MSFNNSNGFVDPEYFSRVCDEICKIMNCTSYKAHIIDFTGCNDMNHIYIPNDHINALDIETSGGTIMNFDTHNNKINVNDINVHDLQANNIKGHNLDLSGNLLIHNDFKIKGSDDLIEVNPNDNIIKIFHETQCKDLIVHGDLTVLGANVTATDLTIEDSVVKLCVGNDNDDLNSGIFTTYQTSNYSGILRDHTDGSWKIFKDLTENPIFAPSSTLNNHLGDLMVNNITISGTLTVDGISIDETTISIYNDLNLAPNQTTIIHKLVVNDITQSTNSTEGSATFVGGVGIGGNLCVNGRIETDKLISDNIGLDGNLIKSENVNGNIEITPNGIGKVIVGKRLHVNDGNQSSSTSDGALVVMGGLGVGGNINAGGNLTCGQLRSNNFLFADNTISSLDSNGDIILNPHGSGTIILNKDTVVNNINAGAISSNYLNVNQAIIGQIEISGDTIITDIIMNNLQCGNITSGLINNINLVQLHTDHHTKVNQNVRINSFPLFSNIKLNSVPQNKLLFQNGNGIQAYSDISFNNGLTLHTDLKTNSDILFNQSGRIISSSSIINLNENITFSTSQEALRINQNGHVGINTDPIERFDVNGNIRVSGFINGIDLVSVKNNLDEYPNELKTVNLNALEQLNNLNTSVNWQYLSNMDQHVRTVDSVQFANINADSITVDIINNAQISSIKTDLDEFPDSLKGLTEKEINQIQNINDVEISNQQWQYLSNIDQNARTTDNVTFANVTTGLINGIDVIDVKNDLDEFPDELKLLPVNAIQQIENINNDINENQWKYMGNLDQDLTTKSNVVFNEIHSSTITINNPILIQDNDIKLSNNDKLVISWKNDHTLEIDNSNLLIGYFQNNQKFSINNEGNISAQSLAVNQITSASILIDNDINVRGGNLNLENGNLTVDSGNLELGSGNIKMTGPGTSDSFYEEYSGTYTIRYGSGPTENIENTDANIRIVRWGKMCLLCIDQGSVPSIPYASSTFNTIKSLPDRFIPSMPQYGVCVVQNEGAFEPGVIQILTNGFIRISTKNMGVFGMNGNAQFIGNFSMNYCK